VVHLPAIDCVCYHCRAAACSRFAAERYYCRYTHLDGQAVLICTNPSFSLDSTGRIVSVRLHGSRDQNRGSGAEEKFVT
jgi:hypothetical protein